ncbi:tRNA (adenosine(37)-N6)-dimethylallyltransferase MiaA, partial [Candidatus Sumerlaeota bacterium]|nr:tRNA (adenosine(37)-N6)-dimethylallyltransferase MiaA [Candidatus Sumerlaeota bacterium]
MGKTELALRLARRHPAEIISADSMQVYKYLNIGTDKPTPEKLQGVPYHLIDFVDPAEQFNVAEFIRLADKKIAEITQRGKFVLVVGGTGMYIKALLYGIFEEPSKDPDVRRELLSILDKEGLASLYTKLQKIDPESARRIHPSDRLRILRALEVFYVTGKKISSLQHHSRANSPRYKFHLIVLNRERSELYKRIDQRVDKMINAGLVEEVKNLLNKGYNEDTPALKALGYRHVVAYLRGKTSLEETIQLIKR